MKLSENSRMLLKHLHSLGDACVGERKGTHYIIPTPSFNWDGRLAPPLVEHPECLQELVDGGYLVFGEHDVGNPTSDYATVCWGHQNHVYTLTQKSREAGNQPLTQADCVIVSNEQATQPDFFNALMKFQYGEGEESDKGFDEMQRLAKQ